MNTGGMLGMVMFPLAMCVASWECVWVAMTGVMGDCRMDCVMGSSSSSE